MSVRPHAETTACCAPSCGCSSESGSPTARHWWLLGASGTLALAAEAFAWRFGSDHATAVVVLAVLSLVLAGREVAIQGWTAVRTFTLNINFLMAIAIVGAAALGNWPEAAMVCFLFAVAEDIESYTAERARNAIRSLTQLEPDVATVKGDAGEWAAVSVREVAVGSVCLARPGERIAFDGTITAGSTSVNQAPITGESTPVEKAVGDQLFAGTVNERGAVEYRVTADEGHSTLARIIHTVESAQAQRAPTQRLVDTFAHYYTPSVVIAALLVAALPPLLFGAPFAVWFYRALVLLVISCPCALVISTPVTVVSGLTTAARRGILIKGGLHLENGRKIRAVALDKTGTLTHGKPVVTDVGQLNGAPNSEIMRIAAGLSAQSNHPISQAICNGWQGEVPPVEGFTALPGRGVTGNVGGRRYYLGNHRLVEENQVCGEHVEDVLLPLEAQGKTVVALTTEKESVGLIAVADTLREAGVEAVGDLHRLGIESVMLTGDNKATAEAVAAKAGIDDVRSELLPEDKLAAIDELIGRYGFVAMVGDGINDAPALAKAGLGIAMGAAGTDVALETADVALMDDDLRKLPEFVQLSKRTVSILSQNISLAVGIKAVFFVLALMGYATLWMAVFADMGASLIVVGNGLRMLRLRRPHRVR